MQGELSALSDDSSEAEEHSESEGVGIDGADLGGVEQVDEVEAAERAEKDEQSTHQAHVTETGDEESFLSRGCRVGGCCISLRVPEGPESDEQVGTKSHDLPEDEHLEEVAGDDESEHSAKEHGDFCVVPLLPSSLVSHVSYRVDEDESGDERGEQHHHAGEAVHVVSEVELKVSDVEPADRVDDRVRVVGAGEILVRDKRGEHEGDGCACDSDVASLLRGLLSEDSDEHEAEHRNERD